MASGKHSANSREGSESPLRFLMNSPGKRGRKRRNSIHKLKFRQDLGDVRVTVYRKDGGKKKQPKPKPFGLALDIT